MSGYAEPKPTLESDIQAFKRQHPHLDHRDERVVAECPDGGQIVRAEVHFESFTFFAPETGEVMFNVRGIKDALAAGRLEFQMFETDLEPGLVEHVRANNGVEAEHMARLTAEDLARPGIIALWPDDHSTVIDGNNRLVRRYDDGLTGFRFAAVTIKALLPFMCRPGEEKKFIEHDARAAGLVVLSGERIAP